MAQKTAKTSLSNKEKEVVNLIVSEVNGCEYCQSAHTVLAKTTGFSDDQILELRKGRCEKSKLNAMVMLAAEMTRNQGRVDTANAAAFFAQGYTNEYFVDLILQIGDTTAMNYLYNLTKVPIDFPIAPELVDIGD